MPNLTVIIATFNGAATIPKTLHALTRLDPPEGGWKLVIVDNGSTDGTKAVVQKFADGLPLQMLELPTPNKNAALNAALEHVEGDLVVFTDDDIIVEPGWLVGFQRLACDLPSFAVFGGRIRPLWPSDLPPWIAHGIPLGWAFAAHGDDLEEGPMKSANIWGGNMAIRRRVFDAGHRFNENYGPRGSGKFLAAGESEFVWRVHDQDNECWFSNRVQVGHQILPVQFTPTWLAARARRFGATRAARQRERNGTVPSHSLADAITELGQDGARWVWSWPTGDRVARYSAIWGINYQLGYLSRRFPIGRVVT